MGVGWEEKRCTFRIGDNDPDQGSALDSFNCQLDTIQNQWEESLMRKSLDQVGLWAFLIVNGYEKTQPVVNSTVFQAEVLSSINQKKAV